MRPYAVTRRPAARRLAGTRGTTFIELVLVLGVMTIILGSAVVLMKGARDAWSLAGTESRLQESGRHMLAQVLTDLKNSGLSTVGAQNYPAIWERARGPESTARGNLVATLNYNDAGLVSEVYAYQGDGSRIARNATRISNEVVFQRPADLDGDGTPLDALGNLEWGGDLISYRVVEDAEGVAWLTRYIERNGQIAEARRLGPGVASATFDAVLGDRSVRFNQVAVVLYLEGVDGRGRPLRTAVEGTIVLRNTREL